MAAHGSGRTLNLRGYSYETIECQVNAANYTLLLLR
jgi:hypothetical protein